jgi:hypothetical protein
MNQLVTSTDSYVICVCLRIVVSNTYCVVLSFCFVFLRLAYSLLPVSLNCPCLIAHSVFSNVYFITDLPRHLELFCTHRCVVLRIIINYVNCNFTNTAISMADRTTTYKQWNTFVPAVDTDRRYQLNVYRIYLATGDNRPHNVTREL